MNRGWWSKVALIAVVTLAAVWSLIPSYYSLVKLPREERNNMKLLEEKLPKWAPPANFKLNLGLDLQGGIHMVMRVDTRTALQKRTERRGIQVSNYLKDKKLEGVQVSSDPENLELTLTVSDVAKAEEVEKSVLEAYPEFSKLSRDGGTLKLKLQENSITRFKEEAVDQAMLVIRRRIDKWGVAEVDVRKLGTDAIQISLPGQQDPERAKEIIGKTAQLEFRMVDDSSNYFQDVFQKTPPDANAGITLAPGGYLEGRDRDALVAYVKGKTPADREVLWECVEAPEKKGVCLSYKSYLVEKNVPLTGESLTGADVGFDERRRVEVNVSFDAQGSKDFEELTAKNVGRRMAIVLDDNVQSAPNISEKIGGGRARITLGQATLEDAQNLALALKAGALPAPVTTGEIRQVGASLGDELIRDGSLAAAVGLLLVLLFMAVYYRVAGIVADVALILNGVLILAGLALFNATLTLPGIAGFVLTLGIAVDANVLINERIREELRHGKTARAAVDQGYDRAFWTIFDAHVTTLIAAFILFFTGTGPIRGFATSLIIGIIASLYTSIVVTRVVTTYLVHGRNAQRVSV